MNTVHLVLVVVVSNGLNLMFKGTGYIYFNLPKLYQGIFSFSNLIYTLYIHINIFIQCVSIDIYHIVKLHAALFANSSIYIYSFTILLTQAVFFFNQQVSLSCIIFWVYSVITNNFPCIDCKKVTKIIH